MTIFTEKQLKLIRQALRIGTEDGSLSAFGADHEIESLKADIDDLLMFEREAKRQRKKSLAIERRIKTGRL